MKSTSYLLCAILLSSAVHAGNKASSQSAPTEQPCCLAQGEPLDCYCPAFNAPAAINVNYKEFKCAKPKVNGFFDASFIYWYAGEDGLKIASNGVLNSGTVFFAQNTRTIEQSSNYKPGFKVGLGVIGEHEWMFHAEYTWYRGKNTTHSGSLTPGTILTAGIPATTALNGTEVWIVDDWFLQGAGGQALSGSSVSSTWRINMDLLDAVAGRPFYQGRSLVISPYAGLRAAWIRQSMTVQLTEAAGLFTGTPFAVGTLPPQPIGSRNHSNSWALGPRVGFNGEYLLPRGFRIEGDFAASLLYTKYTSLRHSEDRAATSFNPGPYTSTLRNFGCLRPEADMGLGIGWGMYLGGNDYHIDFSADYDFMIFWSQNMLRTFLDDTLTGTGPGAADLYFHGLTITGRFDF